MSTNRNWESDLIPSKIDCHGIIDAVLATLLYQNGTLRELTHRTLNLIEETKTKVGEANAWLLEGIRQFNVSSDPFKYFTEAEEKGCSHSALHHFIGECYRRGDRGVGKCINKAQQYYGQAFLGGSQYSHIDVLKCFASDSNGNLKNAFHSSRDLEIAGIVDPLLYVEVGHTYLYRNCTDENPSLALWYFQRGADMGSIQAYASMYFMWWDGSPRCHVDRHEAVTVLLNAEERGIGAHDHQLLSILIDSLLDEDYVPNRTILGTFNNKWEMALHYCDVLIQRGSSVGYHSKATLYRYGNEDFPQDIRKAVEVWEEADKAGLANFLAYTYGLINAYTYGWEVPKSTDKVLEYCKKALELAPNENAKSIVYSCTSHASI